VKGWCLQGSPQTAKQPPPYNNFTDAQCCAWCVAEKTCFAWNTNSKQRGTAAGGCHSRKSVATPNKNAPCNFGVVRAPKPLPKPKRAPKGAKNILAIVTDDFRPWIEPWTTGKYDIKAPNLKQFAAESMVFHNAYVQQAVCGARTQSVCCIPDSRRDCTLAAATVCLTHLSTDRVWHRQGRAGTRF
jgi:hypothetical protein